MTTLSTLSQLMLDANINTVELKIALNSNNKPSVLIQFINTNLADLSEDSNGEVAALKKALTLPFYISQTETDIDTAVLTELENAKSGIIDVGTLASKEATTREKIKTLTDEAKNAKSSKKQTVSKRTSKKQSIEPVAPPVEKQESPNTIEVQGEQLVTEEPKKPNVGDDTGADSVKKHAVTEAVEVAKNEVKPESVRPNLQAVRQVEEAESKVDNSQSGFAFSFFNE